MAQMTTHFTQFTPKFTYVANPLGGGASVTRRFYFWSQTPNGPSSRKTCLIINMPGSGGNQGGPVWTAIGTDSVDLSAVIHPITRDTFQFISVAPGDSAIGNGPPLGALPGLIRYWFSLYKTTYNLDTTRVYYTGQSLGAMIGEELGWTDTLTKYFAAVQACTGPYFNNATWMPVGGYTTGIPSRNTAQTFLSTRTAVWNTHGNNDLNYPIAKYGYPMRDSMSAYMPASIYHFSVITDPRRNFHGGWDYNALDTLPTDVSYWSWSDNSNLGRGGKPFYGSIYSWFLLFTNTFTPGGNAGNLTAFSQVNPPQKYFPIITGAARLIDSDITTVNSDNNEKPITYHADYADCVLCSSQRSNRKRRNNDAEKD